MKYVLDRPQRGRQAAKPLSRHLCRRLRMCHRRRLQKFVDVLLYIAKQLEQPWLKGDEDLPAVILIQLANLARRYPCRQTQRDNAARRSPGKQVDLFQKPGTLRIQIFQQHRRYQPANAATITADDEIAWLAHGSSCQ